MTARDDFRDSFQRSVARLQRFCTARGELVGPSEKARSELRQELSSFRSAALLAILRLLVADFLRRDRPGFVRIGWGEQTESRKQERTCHDRISGEKRPFLTAY